MGKGDRRRFLQLVIGIGVSSCVGSAYIMALFVPHLKEQFHFTTGEVTTVTTVSACIGFFAMPSGMIYDAFGPKTSLCVGALLFAFGYGFLALSLSEQISHSVATLSVLMSIAAIANNYADIGSLLTNLYNFPQEQGSIVMIQKTFMGLGSSIFSLVSVAFFHDNLIMFTVFVMAFTTFMCLLGAAIISRPSTYLVSDSTRPIRFRIGTVLLFIFFGYTLVANNILTFVTGLSSGVKYALAIIVLVLFLSFFAVLIPPEEPNDEEASLVNGDTDATAVEVGNEAPSNLSMVDPDAHVLNERGFLENLRGLDLWLMWWVLFTCWGTGVMFSSNLSEIYRSVCFDDFSMQVNGALVSVFGAGSAFGRIVSGFLKGRLQPLSLQYPMCMVVSTIGTALFLVLPCQAIGIAVFLFATGFGWSWAATVMLCKRTYLKSCVGKHYNFAFTSGMLSPVVINYGLFGKLYDRETRKQNHGVFCKGIVCFSTAFGAILALLVTGVIASVVYHIRWKKMLETHESERKAVADARKGDDSRVHDA